MNIPFTRNGKLDDTYDTKDSVYTLYTKITSSSSTLSASGIYTDPELTNEITSTNPLNDPDVIQYLYSGKLVLEARTINPTYGSIAYWRVQALNFFGSSGLLNKIDADNGPHYDFSIEAPNSIDMRDPSKGFSTKSIYILFVSAD